MKFAMSRLMPIIIVPFMALSCTQKDYTNITNLFCWSR